MKGTKKFRCVESKPVREGWREVTCQTDRPMLYRDRVFGEHASIYKKKGCEVTFNIALGITR